MRIIIEMCIKNLYIIRDVNMIVVVVIVVIVVVVIVIVVVVIVIVVIVVVSIISIVIHNELVLIVFCVVNNPVFK
jgi:hypothetical protein